MSRIRRLSQVISEEGRRALASQQALRIRDTAFGLVDQANLNASTTRKITKKAAFTVVLRSLQATRNLPFSLREHMAIKELSQYITLAQSDKSNSLTLSNTDLLPISHPRSTRNHSMTASALTEARARWIADDPRIIDGYAKTIIASALTSEYASVEHVYYNSILSNLPQGVVPTEVIIAASNPFSGGNSSAERSLRARLQRRDREGKFAFMGGGLSALIRKSNGKVYNLVGRPIVDGPNGDDIQMQLPDGKIVNIPASKGMFVKAVINPTSDGFSKNTAKTATTGNIINEEDLVYVNAPQGWKKTGDNAWESNDGKYVITGAKDKNGFDRYEVKDAKSGKTISNNASDWEDALDAIAEKEDGKKAVLPSNAPQTQQPFVKPPLGDANKQKNAPGKFEFNYPDGAVKIKIDESYDPEGRVDEESPDFTDDPAELAQIFDPRDLVQALEQGVLPESEGDNATGYGVLRFNGGDEFVPVQAIYNALGEAGEDAPLELARIYDNGLGGNDNENALKDNRKGVARLDQSKPDVAESFERTVAMSPDEAPATQEPKFDSTEMDQVPLPPVLDGLSDAEMKQFMETGDHTPYLPENDSIDMPEGYNTLDPSPFQSWREVTADTPDAVLPEGFSDNPVFLAQSIDKQSLETELRRSLEPNSATPGYANISLQDEDGEEFVANVPGEAVRDALQLQGVDTNELIKSIADEGFAGQNNEIIMDPAKDGNPSDNKEPIAELPSESSSVEEKIKADQDYVENMKGLWRRGDHRDALQNYKQQGPHDPLDPAYKDEWKNEFEDYLSDDSSPDGVFNDLLRSNPDFARLFAWHQFDQMNSPVHADWQPSDSDARERFDAEDAKHALIEEKYGKESPTPAVAVGAGLNVLMAPDYFYFTKEDKLTVLKDALRAFTNEDAIGDLQNHPQEVAAMESVAKSIEAEIAKLEAPNANPDNTDNTTSGPSEPEVLSQLDEAKLNNLLAEIKKNPAGYTANGLNFYRPDEGFGAKADYIEVVADSWEPGDPVIANINNDGGVDWNNDQFDKYSEAFVQAIEGLGTESSDNKPQAPKEINDEALLDRRLAGESLDSVAEDLGIPREEVRRREMDALRKRREANPELPPTPEAVKFDTGTENRELIAKFNRQYVKEFLDQEEALADRYQAEEDMPRGDAQAAAEADMKRMFGKTAMEALNELPREEGLKVLQEREQQLFNPVVKEEKNISEPSAQAEPVVAIDVNSPNLQDDIQSAIDKNQKIAFSYNGKDRIVLPQSIWTNPKNGNVNLRAIEDGTDGGYKVFTLDKMEMAKSTTPPPPVKTKPRELSEADKAVIKNNEYVIANAGTLQPTEARNLQVGDFFYNAFFGRYEEILAMEPAPMGRIKFTVFNVYNNKEEERFFEMDSPLRNVRRPGIEDQAEPIPSVKAARRGGPRGLIKRVPLSEQVRAKEGRRIARQKEEEGLFKDVNGVAVKPGDVVVHPKHPEWGRGVVKLRIGAQVREGKKAGGQVRAGVVQPNKLVVQFEGGNEDWVFKNAGRELKAGNIELFDGNYDDLVLDPRFRGGAMIPNAPAKPAPANPVAEQGRLLDTPEAKPAAPAAPNMPKAVYKAEVEDQKGNKFKISVVKIDDMYEAAVFNEDGKLNAVIAKNVSFGEIQGVIGKFIGDVADSNDGEKVLRVYGDLPEPVEQLVLTGDTPDVPPLPAVKTVELKEAKARAKALADAVQDKDIPGDARKDLTENEQLRMKSYMQQYLAPSGTDRRQNARFSSDLGMAYRYAVKLGWFEEAQEIAALQKKMDKLPLRDGGEDFNNKIADLREMHPEFFGNNMELELAKRLDFNGRKRVNSLMDAFNDILINPDVYNPTFRAALIKGRGDIDSILSSIDRPNPVPADAEVIDRLKELKKRFDAIGDLPKLPSRERSNDDMANHLADVARGFEGLGYNDLLNGYGDWKFERKLSTGNNLNTVFLLRNALTGERVVIKYDNDGNRGVFKGNGIKAEEMVAELYRDLGFAQPAVAVINPDNPTPEIGGVAVMQYADAGFFGLVDVEVHNKSSVYSLDQVGTSNREELLNFLVANAIIGNTDRHGGNFMWGTDPATGKVRLVPIDNGLAMFNGQFGEPEKNINDPLHLDPFKVIVGRYGNFNQVGPLGKKWINQIGEEAAKNQIVDFATRMRERAEAMKFRDPRANEYLMARADAILKNPQKFIDTVLRFWQRRYG